MPVDVKPIRSQDSLAQVAGVTRLTIHRALTGQPGVGQATRQRIRRLADKYGYRPNAAARSTRTGRFGAVALLLGTRDGCSTLPPDLLNGIHDGLAAHDLNLMVVRLPDERLTDADYVPRILRETASDGLLIDYTHDIPLLMLDLIAQAKLPAVWINVKREHDCVHPDDFAAAKQATQRLLASGRRRVAWADFSNLDPDHRHYSAADRRAGYAAAMIDAGLTPRFATELNPHQPGVDRECGAQAILSDPDRPDALVCYADTTAAAFIHAAQRLGINIPGELSLLSFDPSVSPLLYPRLSTMLLPSRAVGEQAVAMLQQRIHHPHPVPAVTVPFTYEAGETV